MRRYFQELLNRALQFINSSHLSSDAKTRLQHYSVFLSLGIPTMVIYGLINLFKSEYLLFTLIIISATGLIAGWFVLRHLRDGRIVYRINILLYSLLILYMLFTGGVGGSKILWMYTLPLISFFLFGKKEGLFWSMTAVLTGIMLLFNPFNLSFAYEYPDEFKTRFVVTYLIVSAVTYWFEYFRNQYRIEIEHKNKGLEQEIAERNQIESERELLIKELQVALDEVKSLEGIIPICMHCKQIRDDKGYWNMLEQYIAEHSDAQFSHSICPDCVQKHYPEL